MAVYRLTEAYSDSLPQWVLKGLGLIGGNHKWTADRITKRGIDLAHATFVPADPPTSGRDAFYKDPNKLPVYLLDVSTPYATRTSVYAPGINDGEQIFYNGEYWNYGDLSRKALLDRTIDFGYIVLNDPLHDPRELRKQRSAARSGVVDRKANAQYQQAVYDNKLDNGRTDWDTITGYKWVTKPGYDKSGYKLDPEKYVRKLNQVGLDNYSEKLERYYNMITKAQQDAAKWITDFDPNDLKGRRDFRDITGYLDRAIYYYKELVKSINGGLKRIENGNSTRENVEASLRNWVSSYGKDIYDYLKEFNKELQGER